MHRTKKMTVIICLVSMVAAMFCGCSSRRDFNIKYSPKEIEAFLNVVCKNMNADRAKVTDPDYDGPASGSCYTAEMEVKLAGKVEENVQMRFYNKDESDKVSWGQIIIYNDDSENELNCKLELIYALEKTLSGKVMADKWISSPRDVKQFGASTSNYNEIVILAEYMLNDNLKVTISGEEALWDWRVYYRIDNTDLT